MHLPCFRQNRIDFPTGLRAIAPSSRPPFANCCQEGESEDGLRSRTRCSLLRSIGLTPLYNCSEDWNLLHMLFQVGTDSAHSRNTYQRVDVVIGLETLGKKRKRMRKANLATRTFSPFRWKICFFILPKRAALVLVSSTALYRRAIRTLYRLLTNTFRSGRKHLVNYPQMLMH